MVKGLCINFDERSLVGEKHQQGRRTCILCVTLFTQCNSVVQLLGKGYYTEAHREARPPAGRAGRFKEELVFSV